MVNFDFLNDGDPNEIRIDTRVRPGRESRNVPPPKKPSQSSAGCLGGLLLFAACTYWASTTEPVRPRNAVGQARRAPDAPRRIARADDYVPPPLGNNPGRYLGQLYRDLKRFRDEPLFRQVGFGQGQRFFPWQQAVQQHVVQGSEDSHAAWGRDWLQKWMLQQNENHPHAVVLPGELIVLGLNAYSREVWPYDEMSGNWEAQFGREE
jgi:hypothetical protein